MQNREAQNPKTKSGLDDSRVRGLFFLVVVSVGGFVAGKIGGYFNLSVSNGGLFFFCFKKPDLVGFKTVVGIVQTGQ